MGRLQPRHFPLLAVVGLRESEDDAPSREGARVGSMAMGALVGAEGLEGRRWERRPRWMAGSMGDSGPSGTEGTCGGKRGSSKGSGACGRLKFAGPLRVAGRCCIGKGLTKAGVPGEMDDCGLAKPLSLSVSGESVLEGRRDGASDEGGVDLELSLRAPELVKEWSDAPESEGVCKEPSVVCRCKNGARGMGGASVKSGSTLKPLRLDFRRGKPTADADGFGPSSTSGEFWGRGGSGASSGRAPGSDGLLGLCWAELSYEPTLSLRNGNVLERWSAVNGGSSGGTSSSWSCCRNESTVSGLAGRGGGGFLFGFDGKPTDPFDCTEVRDRSELEVEGLAW